MGRESVLWRIEKIQLVLQLYLQERGSHNWQSPALDPIVGGYTLARGYTLEQNELKYKFNYR